MGPRCLSSKDARAPYTLVVRAPGKKTQRLPMWKMPGVDITINRNSYGFGILNPGVSSNGDPQALTDVTLLQFPPSSIWYGSPTHFCVGIPWIQNRH